MKFFSRCFWLVLILGMCSACGQKGKLVLPVKPPAISTPYPTAQPKKVDGDTDSESEPASKPAESVTNQPPEKN
jgi:hypothetical protein